ncbi:MAG: hypothetical protein ACRKFN_11480 [Desulfitobacterium sp.]
MHFKTLKNYWVFESSEDIIEFEGDELVLILDDLSEQGFELVTGYDDEYILRSKEEVEEEREYFFFGEDDEA